ncbi:MAG: aspartate/glutamate racemase family protein [Hyphomicrobiales bacterium]|nr:aspartate/glutamate racemase family protein [Hyphomicrobiales bacterium]MBV8661829.1 aspartate/glutamate racemase family protein [Hyphomicrobiales bacterium]
MDEQGPLIGVLGGLGPLATADFLKQLVQLTPATRDQDHFRSLVFSNPHVHDRSHAILGQGLSPLPQLLAGVGVLERNRVDVIAIPCNSSHYWLDELRAATPIPFLSILAAVRGELERRGVSGAVGLMATSGTVKSGIYQRHLAQAGFDTVEPDDEEQRGLVEASIRAVKAGRVEEGAQLARSAVARLEARGARAIVLGCTELPIIVPEAATAVGSPIVNSTAALAAECVAWATGKAALTSRCVAEAC